MYGAIAGDIVGSIYEWNNIKTKQFPLFKKSCFPTDDSFMTVAVASACIYWKDHHRMETLERDAQDFKDALISEMHRIGNRYPDKGYGGRFRKWLLRRSQEPYHSCGNGSAMRVSPCAFAANSLWEAELLARLSAEVTHDHPEGVKGAQATAAAIYLARTGKTRSEIRDYIRLHYYPLEKKLSEIRPVYRFNETCQGTVPEAIEAFLESASFEDAIRNAISLGGDSDTLAAITGGIAEAYYGIPKEIKDYVKAFLRRDMDANELRIIRTFRNLYAHAFHVLYDDVVKFRFGGYKEEGPAVGPVRRKAHRKALAEKMAQREEALKAEEQHIREEWQAEQAMLDRVPAIVLLQELRLATERGEMPHE